MVLTPRFSLSQSSSHLNIHIVIPNVRVSGMEITVISLNEFSFYCRPYLLTLQLPGGVHDEEALDESHRPRAVYDPKIENGTVTVHLTKLNAGEEFANLDMLTSLMKVAAVKPRTGKGRYGLGVDGEGMYGFANGFQDFFGVDGFLEEFPELIDLPHPDETSREMRTVLRTMHEDALFSPDRYRADLFHGAEDDLYRAAWSYIPQWMTIPEEDLATKFQSLDLIAPPSFSFGSIDTNATFTFGAVALQPSPPPKPFFNTREARQLSLLTAKEFSAKCTASAMLKIVDVLLAFCYECRMCCLSQSETEGEEEGFTVESHWTIRKLSATLSWLEEFASLDQVFGAFARRCLCFPYLRRWDLCCRAALDCAGLLADARWALRALLHVQSLFTKSQSAYLLNRLFIDDMCVFVQQSWDKAAVKTIQQEIKRTFDVARRIPAVELVGWNLAKASSSRKIDRKALATSHLSPKKNLTTNSSPPIVPAILPNERNLVEELD